MTSNLTYVNNKAFYHILNYFRFEYSIDIGSTDTEATSVSVQRGGVSVSVQVL